MTSTYSGTEDSFGILCRGNVEFTPYYTSGEGTLIVTVNGAKGSNYGVYSLGGSIYLQERCRVTVRAGIDNSNVSSNYGVRASDGTITVVEDASLMGDAGAVSSSGSHRCGVYAEGSIDIKSTGSITGVSGKTQDSYDIYSGGNIYLNSGSLIGISEGMTSSEG